MSRVIVLLLDSFGIGYTEDAERFGDYGADTLGHIAEWCETERKNEKGEPRPLFLPNMNKLGLGIVAANSRRRPLRLPLGPEDGVPAGACGFASPISRGKDTLSGHWEIMGVPVEFEWGYFTDKEKSFPKELIDSLIVKGNLPGVLGEKRASGTEIIKELGVEHCKTGKPIVYTSADSVLQIAAHEEYFGLERLYDLCKTAFELVRPYRIARVIARPFRGEGPEDFVRTGNRHDYAVPAVGKTLLDFIVEKGGEVHAIGKIADIFAHRGITKHYPATGLANLFAQTMSAVSAAEDNSLIFTNFVDFDSSFGHRRDVAGYAAALEQVDNLLPAVFAAMGESDVGLITADHGCDPTWQGSDHTRENIPVLFFGKQVKPQILKPMETFSDIGQTLAEVLGLKLNHGKAVKILFQEV
ncbi:MAG: phosphopentomutase [Acholeplasmataceae bacterium]|nr:phosphopentomutase [Acholeplasmataceae bacterium]